jgi:C-terminal processing protease CtpA/Prc
MANKLAFGVIFSAFLCLPAVAQTNSVKYTKENIAGSLGFEGPVSNGMPAGWFGNPSGTVVVEGTVVHSGQRAVRFDRTHNPAGRFSAVGTSIPVDFLGSRVELRGFLRTENVSDFAGLWLREDDDSSPLALDNMQAPHLAGTHDWQEYSVTLALNPDARRLVFGALLSGNGTAWADDLELLVDGRPVAQAPPRKADEADQESDHEFDHGSGIQLKELTPLQIGNLATLARVWGFLKYHHPAVTAGKHRWDYDLFRIMPQILSASSHQDANALLAKWIDSLGPIDECSPCTQLGASAFKLKPDLDWIYDAKYLGVALSGRLQAIYRNRVWDQQYYVALAPGVGNPVFKHESEYAELEFPDSGVQLLGLFRLWNIVEYWAPDRDVVGEDWNGVLNEFIPRIGLAKDHDAYGRAMLAMIAQIHDTHANLWNALNLRPPTGSCRLPVNLRFVKDKAIVTGFTSDSGAKTTGLKRGDELAAIDSAPVSQLVADWAPLYADSNQAARLRDMARNLTNGNCGPVRIGVRRENTLLAMNLMRVLTSDAGTPALTHDLPGPTFRLLSKDIAYLKLSSVKAADVPSYIESAKGTRGLIVDIRNYPSEFVVFRLGSLLVRQVTPFAVFTKPDLANPGAFHAEPPVSLTPSEPHYDGKVVILVDETTLSQAEYTSMALRSTPNAIVVGSTTAGADGNVSDIPLPGRFRTMISGLGVFYPDGSPTQRVGIRVDVQVLPTVAGIRDGRDEALEMAIRQIVPALSDSDVERIARP